MKTFLINPSVDGRERATPFYTAELKYDKASGRVFMKVAVSVRCSNTLVAPRPGYPSTFAKEVDIAFGGFLLEKHITAAVLKLFSNPRDRAILHRCLLATASMESDSITSFLPRRFWVHAKTGRVRVYPSSVKLLKSNPTIHRALGCIYRHLARAIITTAISRGIDVPSSPAEPVLYNIITNSIHKAGDSALELCELWRKAPTAAEKVRMTLNRVWYGYINFRTNGRTLRRCARKLRLVRPRRLQDAQTPGRGTEKDGVRRGGSVGTKGEEARKPGTTGEKCPQTQKVPLTTDSSGAASVTERHSA